MAVCRCCLQRHALIIVHIRLQEVVTDPGIQGRQVARVDAVATSNVGVCRGETFISFIIDAGRQGRQVARVDAVTAGDVGV